uniref:Uncharacterized protein n=1 Tax=Tanacetum cinerariifolium TaxID=118510 RepID=A0A6L2JKH8_TANCI|nr:hypothetical protein [Tanacetum cinerariifolium]
MKDEESKLVELQEVVEVVTTAKLITKVVTAASATITAADTLIPAATITTAASTLTAAPRIMVHEPKPLKKKTQIEQDEAYARELEAELNKNIDWDEVIDQVSRKEKEENAVMRYQALKRKPQTKAHARTNMKFNSNVAFLVKTKEQMKEEDNKALKRISGSQEDKAAKRQKLDEDDDVPVIDYEIYIENNKPYYKIKRADGSHQLYLSFLSMLRNFDREDLEVLWNLVKERFASTKPKNFSNDFLLTTLGAMFEKPDIQAQIWINQRNVHGFAKVKSWKLLESCGVQIITFTITLIDFASGEEISTYKVYSRTNDQ